MNYFVSLGILCVWDAGHRGNKITGTALWNHTTVRQNDFSIMFMTVCIQWDSTYHEGKTRANGSKIYSAEVNISLDLPLRPRKRFALEQSFVAKWRQQVCSISFQTLKPIPVNLHQQGRGNVLNFKQLKLHP